MMGRGCQVAGHSLLCARYAPLVEPPMTPMMEQYKAIKEQHQDCLLFFRLGDFYELFFEDAKEAARLLGITLTARGKDENAIPMCGVPYHAADSYIAKLTKLGKKVAMCDQISDPSLPGIVERAVTRIITPGTTLDDKVLDQKTNNYVMAVVMEDGEKKGDISANDSAGEKSQNTAFLVAFADVTTGEFKTLHLPDETSFFAELQRTAPCEILLPSAQFSSDAGKVFMEKIRCVSSTVCFFPYDRAEQQEKISQKNGGDSSPSDEAAALLLSYLQSTQKSALTHMSQPQPYDVNEFMPLDEATLKNLELLSTLRENQREGSLLSVMDHTLTAMGGRMLRFFLTHPLLEVTAITKRLDAIEEFTRQQNILADARELLKSVMDLERLMSRLSLGRGNARDLLGMKESLLRVPRIREILADCRAKLAQEICGGLDALEDVVALIERGIAAEPPLSITDGGIIADGYHQELDELKHISRDGKQFIQNLQQQEVATTGIGNLKVRYNKVFGYYFEVSKGQVGKVPQHWIRKQTTVNAERYVSPELKEFEEKVLGAEEKIVALEQKLFLEIRDAVTAHMERVQKTARMLALLDVLLGLATLALRGRYCRPEILSAGNILIRHGRHPVVETMSTDARFVPNSVELRQESERFLLITGPNMGGKSTFLRQTALMVLMAQMGSFVPAESAQIGLVDRIFTRVGASDNLVRGQSTFMVEMQEAAHILRSATARSLVILDEIGRGTSTYDGVSIAWAITEYLHNTVGAKTLFATHYHELIALAEQLESAANFSVGVKENAAEGVVFLYTIERGAVDKSYGIEVAQLAGLPSVVVEKARHILTGLEKGVVGTNIQQELADHAVENQAVLLNQKEFSETFRQHKTLQQKLSGLDTSTMTPLEALNMLEAMKREV